MGNDDRNSVVKHVVYELLARYLRFLPQTYQGWVCMRTEVFGVKQKPGIYAGMMINLIALLMKCCIFACVSQH